MSLVGTRPILQDELQKYELHHRARIAIKPGITGMWQVSGRSDITDFEEVVRLDTEYISKHCEFDGVETVLKEDGRYCFVPLTHKVTLGEIVDLLQKFKQQPITLMMPKMPDGSFAKKLYSLCNY